MSEHAVVIAGGGPTGLMLAGELALAGVDAVIVERRPDQSMDGSRAGGLLPRTLEVLDQRGIVDRFVDAGTVYREHGFAGIRFDISDLPTRHNYVLGLWQSEFEPMLAEWVGGLGVPTLREREVVGFSQDATSVDVQLSDGTSLRASYLVGCDGGRSVIRKAAGIDFAGWDPSTSWMIAEVEAEQQPEFGFHHNQLGRHAVGPASDPGRFRVVLTEADVEHTGDPDEDELRDAVAAAFGTDLGLRRAHWVSRFSDMARQAVAYRDRRVLLAGDAAHVHAPLGGQGMQTGLQDAVNLGWKLAQVVDGISPDSLLDTYHAERHPVAARVLRNTMAQAALGKPDDHHQALVETMTELLAMDEPRHRIAAELCGLDIHYDLGEDDRHPLIGRRMPDLDLQTEDGPTRVCALLHDARPVLLDLTGSATLRADPVRVVEATADEGPWELPVVGQVPAPAAVLLRPDGYVAWAGDPTDPVLPPALASWFGTHAPRVRRKASASIGLAKR